MHITREMVRQDMPRIIAQKGEDFQYETHPGSGGTCTYVWDGEPDCLLARYLVDLGLPLEALTPHEGTSVDDLFFRGYMERYGFSADPEALHVMERLQYFQDNEFTWGDAYERTFNSTNEI